MHEKQTRRGKLVMQQTLAVALIVVLASGVVGLACYLAAGFIVRDQIHAQLAAVGDDRAMMLDTWAGRQKERAELIASRTRFRRYLAENASGEVTGAEFTVGARRILVDALASSEDFVTITATDAAGNIVVSTMPEREGRSLADAEAFVSGLSGSSIGEPFVVDEELRVFASAPAMGPGGETLGVVVVELRADGLRRILHRDEALGDSAQIFVGRAEGDGVRSLDPRVDRAAGSGLMAEAFAGESRFAHVVSDDDDVLAWVQPLNYQSEERASWALLLSIDVDEAYAPVARMGRLILLAQLALALFWPLLAFAAATRLTKPILAVTAAAENLAAGNLATRVTVVGDDELAQLARSFNTMAGSIQTLTEGLEVKVAARTRALEGVIEDLQEAHDAARAASMAKSRFLANMSHELRTPLTAIIGFSELILESDEDSHLTEDDKEFLNHVLQSGHHLLALINDVLDISRVEAGRLELTPESVDLALLVTSATSRLEALAADKGVHLVLDLPSDMARAQLDPVRFRQMVYNYISNALKFSEEGGTVTVQLLAEGDDMFRLDVRDTGIGIDEESLARLFTEFERLEAGKAPEHQGTGLGLALTKQLATAMGGRVEVESEVGVGSTFSVVLPYVHVSPPLELPGTGGVPQLDSVLVFSGSDSEGAEIGNLVVEHGLRPVRVSTIDEARRACSATRFAAIFLALQAEQLGAKLRDELLRGEINAETPVIVIADPGEEVTSHWVTESFHRPVDPSVLFRSLERAGLAPLKSPLVLVVDDQAEVVALLEGRLAKHGYRTKGALSAEEGLALVREASPDAIILDLIMPGLSGFDFLRELRTILGLTEVPVVVWTSKDLTGSERDSLEGDAQQVILKGAGTARLVEALVSVVPRSSLGAPGRG